MIHYYLLDTETTGLKTNYHEIVQISLIRYNDKFQSTVNIKPLFPDRASYDVLKILNKSKADLLKGEHKSKAVEYMHNIMCEDGAQPKDRCIIAHNASFDKRFCHSLWESENKEFPAEMWLCSMAFSKLYANTIGKEKFAKQQNQLKPKFGLDMCLAAANIAPQSGHHNAVIDTQNLNSLTEFLFKQNLNHVSLIKREPHKLFGSEQNYDLTDF